LNAKDESLKQLEELLKNQEVELKARRKKLKEREVELKQRETKVLSPITTPTPNPTGTPPSPSTSSSSSPSQTPYSSLLNDKNSSSPSSSSSSFQQMANTQPETLKQGYLIKQGHFVKNWKKRYFSLIREPGGSKGVGAQLYYYRGTNDLKPAGIVTIRGCEAKQGEGAKGEYLISVSTNDPQNKMFFMRAETYSDMTDWILAINKASAM